jgi:hypothetical protein
LLRFSPLFWCEGFLRKSVNCLEFFLKGCVDESMTLKERFAGELFGDYDCVKLSTAAVGFVNNFLWKV